MLSAASAASKQNYDTKMGEIPHFAPFTAAGYFVAHSGED